MGVRRAKLQESRTYETQICTCLGGLIGKRCDLFKELPDKRARPSLYPEPTPHLTLHNQLRTMRITTKSFKLQSHCRILPLPPMGSFAPSLNSSPSKLSRSNALFVPLSRRRAWKKPCTLEHVSSLISMTRSFKRVASTTSRRKKNRKNFWCVLLLLSALFMRGWLSALLEQRSILEADQEVDEILEGRGQRRRSVVSYTDSVTMHGQ